MIVLTPDRPEPEKYLGGIAFGKTIRARRIGAGLTLRRCAERLGLSMHALSSIEQGQERMKPADFEAFNEVVAAR